MQAEAYSVCLKQKTKQKQNQHSKAPHCCKAAGTLKTQTARIRSAAGSAVQVLLPDSNIKNNLAREVNKCVKMIYREQLKKE